MSQAAMMLKSLLHSVSFYKYSNLYEGVLWLVIADN